MMCLTSELIAYYLWMLSTISRNKLNKIKILELFGVVQEGHILQSQVTNCQGQLDTLILDMADIVATDE